MSSDEVKNLSSGSSTVESSDSSSPSSHVLQKSADQRQQTGNTDTASSETMIKKKKSGRKKFRETRHPIYKGVRQKKGKWVCELRQPGGNNKSRLWLGTFSSPDMAARAYDVAALAIRGDSASLNFPDSAGDRIQQQRVGLSSSSTSSASELVLGRAPAAAEAEAISEGSKGSSATAILTSTSSASRNVYVDEEELFNMPGLLDSMAEGLILTPPSMQKAFSWDDFSNLEENYSGDYFSLWTY